MWAEHLCKWLGETTWEEAPDATNWQRVVAIMQADFHDMTLSDKSMCHMVVLIPRGDGRDFQGIGTVEVLLKTVTGLLNRHFTAAIYLNDVLHGFQAVNGMGTAAVEVKLLQQLTAMRDVVIHKIFLDFQKVYDNLDWDR